MPSNPPPLDTWLSNSSPVSLGRRATPVRCYRLEGGSYTELDNIECAEIAQSIGIDPGQSPELAHLKQDARSTLQAAIRDAVAQALR